MGKKPLIRTVKGVKEKLSHAAGSCILHWPTQNIAALIKVVNMK